MATDGAATSRRTGLVVYLAGAGQDASSWDQVRAGLDPSWRAKALGPADLVPAGSPFTLDAAVEGLRDTIGDGADPVVLCGLSIGAIVATAFTLKHPDRVDGLLLSGSQIRLNPLLATVQLAVLRFVPDRALGLPATLDRSRFIESLRAGATADFRSDLGRIAVPTTVLCGSRDRPNLPAAQRIAATVKGAELRIIQGAGHLINTQQPAAIVQALADLLPRVVG